jgi:hypothetical protein
MGFFNSLSYGICGGKPAKLGKACNDRPFSFPHKTSRNTNQKHISWHSFSRVLLLSQVAILTIYTQGETVCNCAL